MTAIVVIGIELSARTQVGLLAAEIITLALFAIVALVKVYSGSAGPGAVHPSLSWINPFSLSPSEISAGMLLAVFIYWGWDTTATVNEETEDPGEAPGRATVISTLILLGIYIVVAFAAQAYAGVKGLIGEPGRRAQPLGTEVFGSPLDKILIIAVLTSAAASTQTTILPTARTTLSMARANAMPKSLGKVHPRFLTPHISTIVDGNALDRLVRRPDPGQRRHPLRLARRARPDDRLLHRADRVRLHDLLPARADCAASRTSSSSASGPTLGGAILFYLLVKNAIELADPANSESGNSWFGLGPPLVIAVFFLLLGVVLMFVQWRKVPEFFRRRPEVVPAGFLEGEAPAPRPDRSGGADGRDRRRPRRLRLRQGGARRGDRAGRRPRRPDRRSSSATPRRASGEARSPNTRRRSRSSAPRSSAPRGSGRAGAGSRSRSSWSRSKSAEALVEVADERDARMIVVGSYGEPPLKGMILGSTPNKLLHISGRPVLVVPGPDG